MKIGFDARMIDHPGIGRYIKCLLEKLVSNDKGDLFVLFGDPEKLKELASSGNVRIVEWTAPIYSIKEQTNLPYAKESLDVLHVPHFNVPLLYRGKMVVTIHDLIYLLLPQAVNSFAARLYARFMVSAAIRKASRVIAVSAHTKKDLVKIFGKRKEEKISVVYEASDGYMEKVEDEAELETIRKKYDLSDKYILYVGSVKPHKNIVTLIEAFSRLRRFDIPHQLVIAGRWDSKEDDLKKAIDANNRIKYIGEVPHEDLPGLYSAATVLVQISLYEGFGLTVLEAMKCGTPVIISANSSLPEVAGHAAMLVSPLNIGQIRDTLYNVLVNKGLREGMINLGYQREGNFSWLKTAAETRQIYRQSL